MIQLRNVQETDLPILFEQQADPEASAMADFPSRDYDAFMNHWHTKMLHDPNVIVQAILYHQQVAGNILAWKHEDQWEAGYWLGKPYWGKGIATQALLQFLPLVPHRPLYGFTAKHNLASQRVLTKCGFSPHKEEPDGFIFILTEQNPAALR